MKLDALWILTVVGPDIHVRFLDKNSQHSGDTRGVARPWAPLLALAAVPQTCVSAPLHIFLAFGLGLYSPKLKWTTARMDSNESKKTGEDDDHSLALHIATSPKTAPSF